MYLMYIDYRYTLNVWLKYCRSLQTYTHHNINILFLFRNNLCAWYLFIVWIKLFRWLIFRNFMARRVNFISGAQGTAYIYKKYYDVLKLRVVNITDNEWPESLRMESATVSKRCDKIEGRRPMDKSNIKQNTLSIREISYKYMNIWVDIFSISEICKILRVYSKNQ